jgi:putative transposase
MPYWRLHYHFIWTTFERAPWLNDSLRPLLYRSIQARAERLSVIVHEIGGIEDHVHVVAAVPPKLAVAECVGQFKGASSHTVNGWPGIESAFRWEEGYGAVSLGERSLPSVIDYVNRQREHHAGGSLIDVYPTGRRKIAARKVGDESAPFQGAPDFSRTIHRPGWRSVRSDTVETKGRHNARGVAQT